MLNRNIQLFIVIAASVLSLIATDILLPSLPQIARHFSVSSNDAKTLISIFMIGQFFTVLLWGMIADHLGRRPALFLGMGIFCIGSLLGLYSDSFNLLLISRFLQGSGAVVVPVAGWALIQDLFPKDEGARIMAWIGSLTSILPLFAPAVGGKLDVLYGWQANLYCIAIYSVVLCFFMLILPRQNTVHIATPSSLKERFGIYGLIIRNKTFISYIALFGLLNSGEWCFLTMAPFYYSHAHISPDIMGLLLMLTATGFVFGSLLASKLFKRFGVDKIIALGIQIALLSSVILLAGEYFHWTDYQIFNALMLGFYIFSSALLWGGTTSRALQCFDNYRGSASAIRSLVLLCFAAFGTYAGKLINHTALYPVGLYLFFAALCALVIFNNKELRAGRMARSTA